MNRGAVEEDDIELRSFIRSTRSLLTGYGPTGPNYNEHIQGIYNWRDNYDAASAYFLNDVVEFAGVQWICLNEDATNGVTNAQPDVSPTEWRQLPSGGGPGPTGPTGPAAEIDSLAYGRNWIFGFNDGGTLRGLEASIGITYATLARWIASDSMGANVNTVHLLVYSAGLGTTWQVRIRGCIGVNTTEETIFTTTDVRQSDMVASNLSDARGFCPQLWSFVMTNVQPSFVAQSYALQVVRVSGSGNATTLGIWQINIE